MIRGCRGATEAHSGRLGGLGPGRLEAQALEGHASRLVPRVRQIAGRALEILGNRPFLPAPLKEWFQGHFETWVRELIEVPFGRRFLLARLDLARIHAGLGLRMCDLLALSEAVRMALSEELSAAATPEPESRQAALAALHRLCDLDILVWLHLRPYRPGACESGPRAVVCGQLSGWLGAPSGVRSESLAVIVDAAGMVVYFDQVAEAVTGWASAEILGKSLEVLSGEPVLPLLASHGEGCDPVALRPVNLVTRSGARRQIQWSAISCGKEENSETLLVGRDVTEEQHKVLESWTEARRASLGHLAPGIAHAIGNMASSISGVLQTLDRKVKDPYVLEKTRVMSRHVDRITEVLQKMVDLGRAPSLEWRKRSITEIVARALEYANLDKRIHRVHTHVALDPGTPPLFCREDYLLEGFLSILLFCLDVADAHPGSDRPELEISTWLHPGGEPGGGLTVESTGLVLEPESRARWIDFRRDGIPFPDHVGLAAGRQILIQHGGKVEFGPLGDDGFRFQVEIFPAAGSAGP